MPTERENLSVLVPQNFNIAGNVLRAFYDNQNHLVFVLDNTIADGKTNALLVINPVGNRKWDDILSNDYGVDLETVRPKKDNKYQKLDIEYSGLAEYDNLINDFKSGNDLENDLAALRVLRNTSIRRVATERLNTANKTADKSRETIARTNDTIEELQTRLKQLRSKLGQERSNIGREPTKQSAAKILRTEAQIDAANEKLRRAKKRLSNAQRRLITADEDAMAARTLLEREPVYSSSVPVPPITTVPFDQENINISSQPKVSEMTNDEVKPLIDENPEIIDEDIAFKPIDFDTGTQSTQQVPISSITNYENDGVVSQSNDNLTATDKNTAFEPLNFTPIANVPTESSFDDDFTSQSKTNENVTDSDVFEPLNFTPITNVSDADTVPETSNFSEPINVFVPPESSITLNAAEQDNQTEKQPVSQVIPVTNVNALQRPVAPITSNIITTEQSQGKTSISSPISDQNTTISKRHGTGIAYYIMLFLLIILSVLTLWLYQQKTTNRTPDLTVPATNTTVIEQVSNTDVSETTDSPFITTTQESVIEENTVTAISDQVNEAETLPTESVSTPIASEQENISETDTKSDMVVESVPDAEIIPEKEDISVTETVTEETESVTDTTINSVEDEILANKPAYTVSQPDDMVVTNQEMDMDAPPFDAPTCDDGTTPAPDGCCAGEHLTIMDDGASVCCPENGMECFPPVK